MSSPATLGCPSGTCGTTSSQRRRGAAARRAAGGRRPRGAVVAPGLHEHRPARPAAVDVRRRAHRPVRCVGRHDLRHRAGLLVGRAAGRRLGELRLRVGVVVTALLRVAEAPVVALAHGLDAGVEREDARTRRRRSGRRRSRCGTARGCRAARRCSSCSRAWRARASRSRTRRGPGSNSPSRNSSTSIGSTPIQCFWLIFTLPGSCSESAYCCSPSIHQASSNLRRQRVGPRLGRVGARVWPADRAMSA